VGFLSESCLTESSLRSHPKPTGLVFTAFKPNPIQVWYSVPRQHRRVEWLDACVRPLVGPLTQPSAWCPGRRCGCGGRRR